MERDTVQRLFRQYYAAMYRVARAILYDEDESKDVVSDVFASLLRDHTILLPDTEERYLMTSVRNRCFKRLRHEDIVRQTADAFRQEGHESDDEDDRLADIAEYVEGHLSAQDQRIFSLRFDQGYTYDEIATAMALSKVAVWKHLSKIINGIKEYINQQEI